MSRRAKNDLIVRVRYQNPLPEPPCPPKLLQIPTGPTRYGQPSFTDSLFDARPFPMVVDAEFGMPLDLSRWEGVWRGEEDDPELNPPREAPLDPRDAFLFEHIIPSSSTTSSLFPGTSSSTTTTTTTSNALPNVSWLRKTEYISKESVNRTSSSLSLSSTSAIDRAVTQPVDVSRERQLELIEESFRAAREAGEGLEALRHPNKPPGVRAVEVLPVLPDERVWGTRVDVFRFSERPGEREVDQPDPRLDSAIIRPMKSEDDDSWLLAYYLLADDAAAKAYREKLASVSSLPPSSSGLAPGAASGSDAGAGAAGAGAGAGAAAPDTAGNGAGAAAAEEEPTEFRFVRDYETMKVLSECPSDWLVVFDDGSKGREKGLYYKGIERRMWLRKRRVRRNDTTASANRWDAIHLRHVPMDETELRDFRETLAEVQDPNWTAHKAAEAEGEAEVEGDAEMDAEGEVDADADAEGEVEVDMDDADGEVDAAAGGAGGGGREGTPMKTEGYAVNGVNGEV